jgi:hypothetical protein
MLPIQRFVIGRSYSKPYRSMNTATMSATGTTSRCEPVISQATISGTCAKRRHLRRQGQTWTRQIAVDHGNDATACLLQYHDEKDAERDNFELQDKGFMGLATYL